MTDPILTDAFWPMRVGVPKDIGWGIAILHEDGTVTRTCKSCQVTSRDAPDTAGRVRGIFDHRAGCTVMEKLAIELPTHCFSCGVYLMGGATRHAPKCELLRLLDFGIPDCECRTRGCGHRASEHKSDGACRICKRGVCWS